MVGQIVGADAAAPADALRARLAATDEEMKKLRRELDAVRMKSAANAAGEATAVEVKGVKLLVQRVDGLERGPMRDLVDQMRGKLGSGIVVLGAAAPRLPHILSVALRNQPADAVLMALDLEGVSASAGSACAAGSLEPSHVVAALGLGPEDAAGVVRFSLGRTTSAAEVDAAAGIVRRVIGRIDAAGV